MNWRYPAGFAVGAEKLPDNTQERSSGVRDSVSRHRLKCHALQQEIRIRPATGEYRKDPFQSPLTIKSSPPD